MCAGGNVGNLVRLLLFRATVGHYLDGLMSFRRGMVRAAELSMSLAGTTNHMSGFVLLSLLRGGAGTRPIVPRPGLYRASGWKGVCFVAPQFLCTATGLGPVSPPLQHGCLVFLSVRACGACLRNFSVCT
jgi:hypothetical protein